ncbi:UNVERIFIED_CONTAM: hypothetical protein K2H54_019452 [Gekko kuhli]
MALPPPDPQYVLRGASDAVNTLCFHCADPKPELPILFSGSSDGLIHVWNINTHRMDRTLNGHGGKSVLWVKTLGNRNMLLSAPPPRDETGALLCLELDFLHRRMSFD